MQLSQSAGWSANSNARSCRRSHTSADNKAEPAVRYVSAEAKIADIEGKIKSLDSIRKSLVKLARSCGGCAPVSECPILESLDREDG